MVELAADLIPLAEGTGSALSTEMERIVASMRDRVRRDSGILVPGVRFRGNEGGMPRGTFIVMIDEIPVVLDTIPVGRRYFVGPGVQLTDKEIEGEPASDPVSGAPAFWVAEADAGRIGTSDGELSSPAQFVVRHVEAVVRRNSASFIGRQEVLSRLESAASTDRDAISASEASRRAITLVCKALAAERVPIRPFDGLCASFRTLYDKNLPPPVIVERLRAWPVLREQLPGRQGPWRYVRCGEPFEDELRRSLCGPLGREMLAIEPLRCQQALSAIRKAVSDTESVLVVRDPALRPHLRKLAELEFPYLPVLSAAEMRDDAVYADRVTLAEALPPNGPIEYRAKWPIAPRPDPAPAPDPAGTQIELAVAPDFLAHRSPADEQALPELLALMRDDLFYELGILVPQIELREDNAQEPSAFRISIGAGEPTVAIILVAYDEFLVDEPVQNLERLRLEGREAANPANGTPSAIVANLSHLQTCRDAGLTVWGPAGCLVLRLKAEIRRFATAFQDDRATRSILHALAKSHPELVEHSLQRFRLPKLGQTLRHLLAEEISCRDLRGILDALLALDGTTDVDFGRFIVFGSDAAPLCPDQEGRAVSELPPSLLADYVRTCLKRFIAHKYTRGSNTLAVYLLAPEVEHWLRETAPGQLLGDPRTARFIEAVRAEVVPKPRDEVLLTAFDVRGTAWRILHNAIPGLPVLCYQELSPDLNISPISRIGWTE